MKIKIKHAFGIAILNENFELEGVPTIEIAQILNDIIDSEDKGFLMSTILNELKKNKELEVEADEELKELLQSLNNQSDDEGDVY